MVREVVINDRSSCRLPSIAVRVVNLLALLASFSMTHFTTVFSAFHTDTCSVTKTCRYSRDGLGTGLSESVVMVSVSEAPMHSGTAAMIAGLNFALLKPGHLNQFPVVNVWLLTLIIA